MKTKPFLMFVMPSVIVMVVFIAGPLITVFVQSFQQTRNLFEVREQQRCDPFGCTTTTVTVPMVDEQGRALRETRWVGWENYRLLLNWPTLRRAFAAGRGWQAVNTIPFWRALRFTLMFTLLTLPLVLIVGLILAFAVNTLIQRLRGPVIFVTLIPFVITPIIGALSIRWLFVSDGILTAQLRRITGSSIAMFAQGWTIELLMYLYRVWSAAPFAFVIFYAALQTVEREQIEAARIDGASRWQTVRNVIIPHLMPLIIFVALIHLMDTYRVFAEIIGFRSEAFVISLQWLTYDFLIPDDTGNRAIGRASASAVLTMIGIAILLIVPLRRSWKAHQV
jgi:multiple sugar transport system permease protein